MQLQVVCDTDLIFTDVYCGWPGVKEMRYPFCCGQCKIQTADQEYTDKVTLTASVGM